MVDSGSTLEPGTRQHRKAPAAPRYSTTAIGNNLIFSEYISSGIVEVPELENPALSLILRTGSPSRFEWRSHGRDQVAELPPGSISLLPMGTREAVRVSRPLPGVASVLEVNSAFFARSIGQIARGGRVELSRQMQLDDPQIRRLMETLRADIADRSNG